jgi:large subunit ribosomal protein L46
MDTWIVARNPIGVYEPPPPTGQPYRVLSSYSFLTFYSRSCSQNLIFFFKAHILAGQVCPNVESIQDFAWLTKEEIKTRVEDAYWMGVKDMLSDF